MAANVVPTTWLGAGYTLASHIAGFTTSDGSGCLPNLSDAEANATTGNVEKIAYELCEKFYQAYLVRVAVPDRPANMTVTRSALVAANGNITFAYTLQFITSGGTPDVIAEP